MDSSQLSSLPCEVVPSRPRPCRSMSMSAISPQKEINIAQKVISGTSGNVLYRQYSYQEIGTIEGTSSLRFSQKFVSEFHIDLPNANRFSDISDLKKTFFDMQSKCQNMKSASTTNKKEPVNQKVELTRKRSHDPSDSNNDYKRKLFKVNPLTNTKKEFNFLAKSEEDDDNVCPRTTTQLLFVIIPFILALLAAFGSIYNMYLKVCDEKLDASVTEHLIISNIFGQSKAVKDIVEAIKMFSSTEHNGLQVMVFTGGTGVGKTYTASLLEETFPWKQNIHQIIMPLDINNVPQLLLQSYPYCGDHLVVIDNLKETDIKNIGAIISYLEKLAKTNKVLVVLIFKFHKQLSGGVSENEISQKIKEVNENLIQSGVSSVIMVDFKTLEKNDVIECIKVALKYNWIPITEEAIDTVLNQVDYQIEGCKRISSKIAVVHELWVRKSYTT